MVDIIRYHKYSVIPTSTFINPRGDFVGRSLEAVE